MSTFQKLLHRFVGQIEDSYTPNEDEKCSKGSSESSSIRRTQSITKMFFSRRQRSLEALKSASCLSCGINKHDRHLSTNNINTLPSITTNNECQLEDKSPEKITDNQTLERQQMKQKRRAKTKLIIIRHGERVDAVFGDTWFEKAFDQSGNYHRFHTNLPTSLPYRQNFQDYLFDPPLTELGLIRSYRTGCKRN